MFENELRKYVHEAYTFLQDNPPVISGQFFDLMKYSALHAISEAKHLTKIEASQRKRSNEEGKAWHSFQESLKTGTKYSAAVKTGQGIPLSLIEYYENCSSEMVKII